MDNRNDLWRHVDANKERLIALSDRVWGMPEVCYTEKRSVAEHVAELKHQGFRITENVADIPPVSDGRVAPLDGAGLGISLRPELFERPDATVRITKI